MARSDGAGEAAPPGAAPGTALDGSLGLFGTENPHTLCGRGLGALVIEIGHALLRIVAYQGRPVATGRGRPR